MGLELKATLKGAIVKEGLAIHGKDVERSDERIEKWVKE